MTKLKPCPFCGSENIKLIKNPVYDANECTTLYYKFYKCRYCGAQGGGSYSERDAAEKWNRRAEGIVLALAEQIVAQVVETSNNEVVMNRFDHSRYIIVVT